MRHPYTAPITHSVVWWLQETYTFHKLTREELETVKKSRRPTTVITGNASTDTTEETTVHMKDLDMFVTVQLLEDTPAALPLGKSWEEKTYSYEWKEGQTPNLFKHGIIMLCRCDNFVPIADPGLSSAPIISGSAHDSAEITKESPSDTTRASRSRLQDLPAWLQ